jgi:LacI family transcriptional regulator
LKVDEHLIIVNDLEKDDCIQAAHQLMRLKPMPDGLFITSDIAAVYCIQTFKQAGISIPKDIAVAGFNNDRVSTIIEPNLTTINYSGFSMGETAARMLINHLRGNIDIMKTNTVILNSELVVRESSLRKG